MDEPGRKALPHFFPSWIDPEANDYFLTICCQQRGVDQLCRPEIGKSLLDSARFYHAQRKWFPTIFLLMPDHVHALLRVGREHEINAVVRAWQRYTATQFGVRWQRDFFEHRLRSDESVAVRAAYILQNPVRAKLVSEISEWPFVWMPEAADNMGPLGELSLP